MEKIGVEVAKPPEEQKKFSQEMEKRAHRKITTCKHPPARVYSDNGASFCRQCEKYIKFAG